MKILFLTKLVLALNLIAISAVAGAEANGGAGGGGGVRSGFKSIQGSIILVNSSVGNFGHGYKKLGGSQCGTLVNGSLGTMCGNSVGNLQLVDGAEANAGGGGGGGQRPDPDFTTTPSGREV